MRREVIIVGGGPGGLHCAAVLAEHNVKVTLLEKNSDIGRKVCAGGITRGGLLKSLPGQLIQREFTSQNIRTRYQSAMVQASQSMVATVDRIELGRYMAEEAGRAGAEIICGARLESIDGRTVVFRYKDKKHTASFDYLVGADGSHSRVRAYLGLPRSRSRMGTGLHYRIPGQSDEMIWHFDPAAFKSGYSWIFPHRECTSVGAYIGFGAIPAGELKRQLDRWLTICGLKKDNVTCEAGLVNHDYRGWSFGRFFLIGDAAGLASPLTGEGINPAILSAQSAAQTIIDPTHHPALLDSLLDRHRLHRKMARLAGRSWFRSLLLSELCAFGLKHGLISFSRFEMA